jgi:hypothetical protein
MNVAGVHMGLPKERMIWLTLSQLACFGFWLTLPFTRLRIGDFGLSEMCGLVAVLALAWSRSVAFVWISFAAFAMHVTICVFTLVNISKGAMEVAGPARDMLAVSYSLVAAIAIANLMSASSSVLSASMLGMRTSVYFAAAALIISLVVPGSIDVWFVSFEDDIGELLAYEEAWVFPRFIGLSNNPNQLAFYLLFVMFFVATVHKRVLRSRSRLEHRAFILTCFALTVLTQSDAALLSVGAGVALLLVGWGALGSPRRLTLVGYVFGCLSVIAIPLLWRWGAGHDGGNGRLELWLSAGKMIEAAAGVGLGYGAHTRDLDGALNESHSVLLDFVLLGGIIGGLWLVCFLFFILRVYLRPYRYWMAVPSLVVLVFCLTYSPLRHPIFWLALFLPFVFSRIPSLAPEGRILDGQ